jgi:predicted AAA+ superfamily ATPase
MKEYKGGMTEQYVFQQMSCRDNGSIFYYSADNSRLKIDFLRQEAMGIVPIEVKAGGNVRSNSLSMFLEKNPDIHAIRYSLLPYKQQSRLTNIPLCAIQ